MRRNPRLFRLTATVALTALLADTLLPLSAMAQPAPPPLPQPNSTQPIQQQSDQADPPAMVGRVAQITGTVSFHDQSNMQWSPASVNDPVSSGNAFWTEPSATTELEIADSRIVLAGTTEFDIATLDANGLQAVAAQGEAYLSIRDQPANQPWSVQTPRGLVRFSGAGRYDIVVGTTEQPTLVTVVDGAADVEGPGLLLHVVAGQSATIIGTDTFQGGIGPAQHTAFLTARLNAERPHPQVQIPPQVALMAGGSDLAGYGNWAPAPDYGQVWYPPVNAGWVPYREGHWAFVAPWGWTWIDDAPWGFAPFHYGRWVQIGGRWAWTPGEYNGHPGYAPALVTFIGIGAGVALGAALAAGTIGWIPLGPHEPFRPWYHASDRYVRDVNLRNVTNNAGIHSYVNRGAATSIPSAAMAASRPVQSVARPLSPQEFATARPIVGQQPLRPTAATAGVTPAVARQFNLAPSGGLRAAPGPAIHAPAAGATFARPAIAPFNRFNLEQRAEPRTESGPLPRVVTPNAPAPRAEPRNEVPRTEARPEPQRELPRVDQPRVVQPRIAPQAQMPRAETERAAPPAPRPEPRRFAPPAPRPEPQRIAPLAPRPELQRAEPQRIAPQMARPEPPRGPAPAERHP